MPGGFMTPCMQFELTGRVDGTPTNFGFGFHAAFKPNANVGYRIVLVVFIRIEQKSGEFEFEQVSKDFCQNLPLPAVQAWS